MMKEKKILPLSTYIAGYSETCLGPSTLLLPSYVLKSFASECCPPPSSTRLFV